MTPDTSLNWRFYQQMNEGRTTVLIVDEAHNLDGEILEEIRLLGNLENRKNKLLQIVWAASLSLIGNSTRRTFAN